MIDESKRNNRKAAKDKVRERMKGRLDPDNYEYFPASITNTDYYDNVIRRSSLKRESSFSF